MFLENSLVRLIVSNKKSAKLNMAIDDALVSNFQKSSIPILRVYNWEKSFTIGISQDIKNYEYLKEVIKDYSKRITGGGVLFHGNDISYSLLIPTCIMKSLKVKESYEYISKFIIDFYKRFGLEAIYAKDDINTNIVKNEFCQVGFEKYDLLVNGIKIGGNAQKRTKDVIFQHGSIPIKRFKNMKISNGVLKNSLEDFNIDISYEQTKKLLIESFKDIFKIEFKKSNLNEEENSRLCTLLKGKYDY